MEWTMTMPLLSGMVFLPLLGALVVLAIPKRSVRVIQAVACVTTLAVLGLATQMLIQFKPPMAGFQFEERFPWIPQINVWYHLGVDGISVGLVFLTALLSFVAALASLGITQRVKEYFVLYQLLVTGMMGTFLALDLFLFYIFWEVVLVPMYFLIGIWGGPRREYAAIKFFIYTLAGSVAMLLAILTCYLSSDPHTFSIPQLAQKGIPLSQVAQMWVFLGFFLAFAIKIPIVPFHTWLPDAHVEAPTPISVILAGILLKMGGYGFFRIGFALFPDESVRWGLLLALLGFVNVVYGALVAMAQIDFKRLVAYSSVSHMGFVLLGMAAFTLSGFNGAMLEMFNHGIITGGMFLLVGVLYDRTHTRDLDRFGGLGVRMPVYAGWLILFSMASLGLPGLSGFVSEFLALLGCFQRHPVITGLSAVGLVLAAAMFLGMIQKVLLGPLPERWATLPDMGRIELLTILPLAFFIFWIGLCPKVAIGWQTSALAELLKRLGGHWAW
jgi:NADH-quinone oxidoreductase subunit M